jgi:Spy/CpxP family protein refolding chaperone
VNFKVFPRQAAKTMNAKISIKSRLFARVILYSITLISIPAIPALARDLNWDSLNLSPQQENQINRLENNWEKTHQEVNAQIEKDMAELKTLLPTGDTQRIRQLQTRITTNKMYLMNESMDTFLKKRDMLTPVQRSQLQKMMPGRTSSQNN